MEFELNIFQGFNTLQLSEEVKSLLLRLGETPENFTRRIIFMSMFMDISCGSKDNENVEELYSAPHIHEQMTTSYYGYDNIMLEAQCDEQHEQHHAHGRAQHAVLSTLRAGH